LHDPSFVLILPPPYFPTRVFGFCGKFYYVSKIRSLFIDSRFLSSFLTTFCMHDFLLDFHFSSFLHFYRIFLGFTTIVRSSYSSHLLNIKKKNENMDKTGTFQDCHLGWHRKQDLKLCSCFSRINSFICIRNTFSSFSNLS